MVSIVVLTYNRKEELKYTLRKVQNLIDSCNDFVVQVVIVDNASTDGTAEMVTTLFPLFKFIRLPQNIGIAGRNEGIKAAEEKYVLILDDDAHIEADSLVSAVDRMEKDSGIGILAFNVVSEQGVSFHEDKEVFQKGLTFCGAASLIRKAVFQEAGYFSRIGFLYHDETDLAIRVIAQGYRIHFAADLIAVHRVSQINRRSGRGSYYSARNTILFRVKYFPLGGVFLRLPAIIMIWVYNMSLRPNRIAYLKGLISGLRLAPKAQAEEGRMIPRSVRQLYIQRSPYSSIGLLLRRVRILKRSWQSLLKREEKE